MEDIPEEAELLAQQPPSRPSPPPGSGECHIWPMLISCGPADFAILDAAERERLERFRVDSARNSFLASRTLQRMIVAHYSGTDPRAVVIDRTCEHCGDAGHGRPRAVATGIDYSVSHSADMLVIAVVGSGRVGVDVEYVQRRTADLDNLARKIMTSQEWACYLAMEPAGRLGFFYRLWTRKEAVVKLTGHGLIQPLSGIEVTGARIPPGTIAEWSTAHDIYLLDLPDLNSIPHSDYPALPAPHEPFAGPDDYPISVASSVKISLLRLRSLTAPRRLSQPGRGS